MWAWKARENNHINNSKEMIAANTGEAEQVATSRNSDEWTVLRVTLAIDLLHINGDDDDDAR